MIQDTKRVQKGRPLPGHLRPEARPSKRKPANGAHRPSNPVALGPPTAEDKRLDEERAAEASQSEAGSKAPESI